MLNEDSEDQISLDSVKIRGGDDSIDEDRERGINSTKVTPSKNELLPSKDGQMI